VKPAPFRYEAPTELEQVLGLLRQHEYEAKVLAGGQSLGPLLNLRMSTPSVLVDMARVAQLHGAPRVVERNVRIAAMTTYREVLDDAVVAKEVPLLAEAIPYVGHQAIRNAGTLGGSVAHADPAAEVPTCLVALGAQVGLVGPSGHRSVEAKDFFTGTFTTELASDEVVAWIDIPPRPRRGGSAWLEVAPRHGDYAIVGVAAVAERDDDHLVQVRVALSGVADRPTLIDLTEELSDLEISHGAADTSPAGSRTPTVSLHSRANALLEEAGRRIASEFRLQDDLIASVRYKQHLVDTLTARALGTAIERTVSREGATS
jgi:carbon-monoxide dehydrogenase medium subunit